MRFRRLTLIVLFAAALSPGLWWRSDRVVQDTANRPRPLVLVPIPAMTPANWPAGLTVAGAWHLVSSFRGFGGYSALLANGDDTLTAISDHAWTLRFAMPDSGRDQVFGFDMVGRSARDKSGIDIESVTTDPATGRRWFGYEVHNQIGRFDEGAAGPRMAAPPAMAHWPENAGPEALVRLADGRFIVLREGAPWLSSGARPGLLFPGDPVEGAVPLEFGFRPPIGYDPTDMAQLPDGRVVILLRALDLPLPPFFRNKLVMADPRSIEPGKPWPWEELATIHGNLPRENYEGLAIAPDEAGVTMWLISDDNSTLFQRTVLLELRWQIPPPKPAGRP